MKLDERAGTTLYPRIAEWLSEIEVDRDGRHASISGQQLSAGNARELRAKLTAAIYNELHTGQSPTARSELPERSIRDFAFEQRLAEVVPHKRTPMPVEVLALNETELIVRLSGLRVSVPRSGLADALPDDLRPGQWLQVDMPCGRPAVSAGFFLVEGSRGGYSERAGLRRMFVHVTDPAAAPGVWAGTLGALEELGARYRAKALSMAAAYPRRDAIVVYLPGDEPAVEHRVAARLTGLTGLGDSTSAFTTELAGGVSAAWEPADPRPGMAGKSFGQHRSTVLAEALLGHAMSPHGAHRSDTVCAAFVAANINPANPAENIERSDHDADN